MRSLKYNSSKIQDKTKYCCFDNKMLTRWTFFRVKLVFEFEFEISWSLGPLDLRTLGPWWHCNYSFKLQVQVEIDLEIETFRVHLETTWTRA